MEQNQIKLVIFDVDGVLIDNKELHYCATRQACTAHGYIYTMEDEKRFDTIPTRQKLELLAKEGKFKEKDIGPIWEMKGYITELLMDSEMFKPNPRVKEIFESLKARGIKVALATNARLTFLFKVMNKLDIHDLVDDYISGDMPRYQKPSPQMYLSIMADQGISPHNTLICEDSKSGKEAAFRSGAHVYSCDNYLAINCLLGKEELNQFSAPKIPYQNQWMNVLIPMAGLGTRFLNAGYIDPKPFITVDQGKTMIERVVENLNMKCNYILLAQKSHLQFDRYANILKNIPNSIIVPIDGITEGAACTALLAEKFIDWVDPLLIVNSDNMIEWDSVATMEKIVHQDIDGCILVFDEPAKSGRYSYVNYARVGHNLVSEVAEKKAISSAATTGHYYWRHGFDFVRCAKKMIKDNIRTNNEFYIAPTYNTAIKDYGMHITCEYVHKYIGLGTPEELKIYQSARYKK